MDIKEFLRPRRNKLVIDAVLSVLWIILAFSIPSDYQTNFLNADLLMKAAILIVNLLFTLAIFYPLLCSLDYLFKLFLKKEERNNFYFLVSILFLLFLNPISYSIILISTNYMTTTVLNAPCGIEIAYFTDATSAYSGMADGDVIIGVGSATIFTPEELRNALKDNKPGDRVLVKTNRGSYNITLIEHPEKHYAVIAIAGRQKYCSK